MTSNDTGRSRRKSGKKTPHKIVKENINNKIHQTTIQVEAYASRWNISWHTDKFSSRSLRRTANGAEAGGAVNETNRCVINRTGSETRTRGQVNYIQRDIIPRQKTAEE